MIFFNKDNFVTKTIELEGIEDGKTHLHIHRTKSRAVLVMYPGADGSVDGYNNKYRKIANLIQSKNIASVVRLDNKYCYSGDLPYVELMVNRIAQVIEYIYNNSEEILGRKEIELYLSGVSAGASAVATILGEFPNIKKVLFIAPAQNAGMENIIRGLSSYKGELYLTAGEDDEIKSADTASLYYHACNNALKKELVVIPNCDHQFTSKKNGMILANAFLWAFSGKGNFPSHRGGMVLYD